MPAFRPPAVAVALGRVSRGDKRGGQVQDPENQLGPLRTVAGRMNIVIAKELSLTMSAWDDKASQRVWEAVTETLKDERADTLMVWSLDRLTRGGVEDAFGKIRHLEEHLGVGFYSYQEPFLSTANTDKQTRELLLSLMAWSAKWESQRKSERLKAKVLTKRNHAEAGGGRAHWGRGRLATSKDVERVRFLRSPTGGAKTLEAIATEVGVSRTQVWRILHDQTTMK